MSVHGERGTRPDFLAIDCSTRDTVSSVGIVRPSQSLPNVTDGMKHVCVFRHALALDERRVKFLPEYAYASPPTVDSKGTEADTKKNRPKIPHTKEVWFAGSHSDMCVEKY